MLLILLFFLFCKNLFFVIIIIIIFLKWLRADGIVGPGEKCLLKVTVKARSYQLGQTDAWSSFC